MITPWHISSLHLCHSYCLKNISTCKKKISGIFFLFAIIAGRPKPELKILFLFRAGPWPWPWRVLIFVQIIAVCVVIRMVGGCGHRSPPPLGTVRDIQNGIIKCRHQNLLRKCRDGKACMVLIARCTFLTWTVSPIIIVS